jgi:hypothetical protein
MICRPTGNPLLNPHGTLIAGIPVRLQGTVVRLAIDRGGRFSGPPGSIVRPIGGATSGTLGATTTSIPEENARRKSS